MNAGKKRIIDNFLDYVELMVRRNSSRLTKLIIQKLLHSAQTKNNIEPDDDEHNEMTFFDPKKNQESITEEQTVFFEIILANLENQIAGQNNVVEKPAVSNRSIQSIISGLEKGEQFSNQSNSNLNVYITGQELSIADIAMFNEIQNVIAVLQLDSVGDVYGHHVKNAIRLKYPCVSSWLNNLDNNQSIRFYQVQFEKDYLEDLKNVNKEH